MLNFLIKIEVQRLESWSDKIADFFPGPNEYVLAGDTHNTLTAPSVFLTTIKVVNNDTIEVTDESVMPGAQDKVDQLLPGE